MMTPHTDRNHFDWPLFLCATAIAVCGVVNLYSGTSVYTGVRSERYISQVYWLAVGGIVGAILAAIDYRHLERLGYGIYAVNIFMLILVFILGREVRGSVRWIEYGPFRFQPSEFMKISLVIALAKFLHDDPKPDGRTLKDLAIPAAIAGIPALLVLRQPDLGTASILILIFFSIAMLTKVKWKSVAAFAITVSAAAPIMWNYVLLPYQRDRVTTFLNPEANLLGTGWHAHHSRVAIGNGGLWGTGYLKGTQNQFRFIPDQDTDFPFPVFAEEWGFIGCLVLIALYTFLVLWGIHIASRAKDRFGAVLSIGCTSILFWHAIINIGMTSGVLPVVGVTLPLFSYGGSSILTIAVVVALLMNVSVHRSSNEPSFH